MSYRDHLVQQEVRKDKVVVTAVMEAIEKKVFLDLTYVDSKGAASKRRVAPLEVKGVNIVTWCMLRNSVRAFKLKQIMGVIVSDVRFNPDELLPRKEDLH